jgi:hypothetical protein
MSNITLHLHQSQMMQIAPLTLVSYKYHNQYIVIMPLKLKKIKESLGQSISIQMKAGFL